MHEHRETIAKAVRTQSAELARPNGQLYKSLSVRTVRKIARDLAVEAREVECVALEDGIIPERYSRSTTTIGPAEQLRLLRSTVALVGLGGLGGWLAEMLARAGVGTLRLIDGDVFDDSNLNRQLFSDETVLGRGKVEVASERLSVVNSSVRVEARPTVFTAANGESLLSGCDAVADCLDSIRTRFTLEKVAGSLRVPLVSAAVAGKSGQVTTIRPGGAGFRAVYGDPAEAPERGAELELGNPPYTVALLASLQCAELIRILLGQDPLYERALLFVDLEDGTFTRLGLQQE